MGAPIFQLRILRIRTKRGAPVERFRVKRKLPITFFSLNKKSTSGQDRTGDLQRVRLTS